MTVGSVIMTTRDPEILKKCAHFSLFFQEKTNDREQTTYANNIVTERHGDVIGH